MKIENLPFSLRAVITFIPCILIVPFDPLLAFCLFIVLFEKCIISIFPLPGIEFTTLATFLFALKYDLIYALFLAFFVPGIIASVFKYTLWKEFKKPDEAPITLGGGTLIDMLMVAFCWFLKTSFTFSLLQLMFIFLLVKHIINFVKGHYTGSVDVIGPFISFFLNIFLILIFEGFFLWLLNA